MRKLLACLCSVSLMLCSCDNTLEDSLLSNSGGGNSLSISVVTEPVTKRLITSNYLPTTSQIGVFVTNTSGGNYDGHSYNNIQYTANGSDASQTWTGSTIELSMNEGKCYAYYPYSSSVTDVTNISVSTSGQDDYMYATPVTVNASNKNASLKMKHALSAVRFMIKKGSYSGAGQVTAVSVKSSALGTTGSLNAKTGEVTEVSGKGSEISVSKSLTLSDVTQDVDVIVVPTGTSADLTLSVTLDGKVYSTVVSSAAVTKAHCNKYTLTVNVGELALSGVEIGDWGYNESGAPTITAGSYKVTFAGDYSDIAFGNSVSGNTVTIKAINYDGYEVKEVSVSSGSSLTQSLSGNTRVITLANITSNVTVIFNGINDWNHLVDGVYAISRNCTPVDISEATSDCIGVALINSATNQRLMIEKYENANNTESANVYKTAAQVKGSTKTDTFSWGGYALTSGTFVSTNVGDGSSNTLGYLPEPNGSYYTTPNLNGSPSVWITTSGALSDFAGKSNSEIIKSITSNNSDSFNYAPMAYLMNAFNDASCSATVNQGYKDWYIPSCGQLGLIWLNKTALDNALTAIGGTAFSGGTYWSSSEYTSYSGWYVGLGIGRVDHDSKVYGFRVRLVRDLI